ncbi:MAG: hypothetical protein ACT4PM_10265, partial [Gemmatimonadales bacterium]
FGIRSNPSEHFQELRDGLRAWAGYAREALQLGGSEEIQLLRFVGNLRTWIEAKAPRSEAALFLESAGAEACWQGLARYWRQRG